MTEEQFKAMLAYFNALIDEKIEDAFGRDSLHESIKVHECEAELRKVLVVEEDDI
jgi:hypothetical protein